MNAQTEIAELQQACLAATGKVKTAQRKKDGTIASKSSDARKARFELLKAEVDSGYCHPVPRPTPADHKAAAASYDTADQVLHRLQEADDVLQLLQNNRDKVNQLLAERFSWRKALCQAMANVPGAFSAEFCKRQIARLNQAIQTTRNALTLRNLHF